MTRAGKPEFLMDADGVPLDFLTPACRVLQHVTGRLYRPSDFPTWDIFDVIGEEHRSACQRLFDEEGFCASILPYPGAVEGVAALRSLVDLHVLTSAMHTKHWYYERVEVMQTHFGLKPWDVTFSARKKNMDGDYFLDDRPKHVLEWAERHPDNIALLYDQPYNRGPDSRTGLANTRRACSWEQVHRVVEVAELHQSLYGSRVDALSSSELRLLARL